MKNLIRLHESRVDADEIDDLGHMNVRYYGERALQATVKLIEAHGLGPERCESAGTTFEVRDTFTRHYREQLAGAPLVVMGGVLEVREDRIRLYHELVNTESQELAASFVHQAELRSLDRQTPVALPEDTRKSLSDSITAWPEHGRSRSIDLDRMQPDLSLAEARDRGLALRQQRRVLAAECDPSGTVPARRRQDLVWGGEPIPPHPGGPPMYDLEDGSRMSMAALETRSILFESPSAGTRIQSFSAIVDIARKTMMRRSWVFDVDRGRLLTSNTMVDIALHLGKRRSIEIPTAIRAKFEAEAQRDLR